MLKEKLVKIQNKLKAPKGQRNTFGNYNYRSCEDILEAVKPMLKEEGLILTISDELVQFTSTSAPTPVQITDKNGTYTEIIGGDRFYVKATVHLSEAVSGDSGDIEFTAYAREEENKKGMDGSQITGASSSYARKYALNGLFLIDDTKDSDATNTGKGTPKAAAKTTSAPAGELKCQQCDTTITTAEKSYSAAKYGKALCRKCQSAQVLGGLPKPGQAVTAND